MYQVFRSHNPSHDHVDTNVIARSVLLSCLYPVHPLVKQDSSVLNHITTLELH